MEEKRREAGAQPPFSADSPASEPASSRRRAGGQKRKANGLNASNSSTTPSKRTTREKASPVHPPIHNGPLTRARQIPNNFTTAATASAPGGKSTPPVASVKQSEHAVPHEYLNGNLVARGEEFNKESKWEALEAAIEAEFEDIRSRGNNAHVVPSHCGWFSWTDVHPIEKHTLPSFFNGKTENRTPDTYIEIRNWIMKKFHANPNTLIELKDLSELNFEDSDAKQEVMEFLDHWGLINFHPFPSMDSAVASADDDIVAEKNSLVEKLYGFETPQLGSPVVPKTTLMTPAMPPGLFPESTIAEELVKQEGPSVEYHCNSCSADCSRKRYHCQKQADFDLCTDCFSNGKFGSGMSSTDFILMEPAEVPGFSGGKWTDQETLLLLEALELYKENWNEIAEHVATKTKVQCILHFLQMPIEDGFFDCDDIDASFKETVDPPATNNGSSVLKDASEIIESKTSDGGEGQVLTPQNETSKAEDSSKVKGDKETPKPEDDGEEKIGEAEETPKPEDVGEVKISESGNDYATVALKETFEAVGFSHRPEGPSSFAEVGNPVMAMAVFFARLAGSDAAVASARCSLKSISANSPSIQLAARHCFVLEDPPDDKNEPTSAERDSNKDGDLDDKNEKQDKSVLDAKDLSNDNSGKTETNPLENKSQMDSINDGASEKPIALKKQATDNHEEAGLDNCNDSSNSKLPTDQAATTIRDSNGSISKAEISPSSVGLLDGASTSEPCQPAKELKDGHLPSDSLPSEKNEPQHSITPNSADEHLQSIQTPKEAELVSNSIPSDESKHQNPLSTNLVGESLEKTNLVMDVDLVSNCLPSEKNVSHPLVTSEASQPTRTEKVVDMMSSSVSLDKSEPSHPVISNSYAENGSSTVAGEDHTEDGTKAKDDIIEKREDNEFEKVKRAAVSTLAAAAVKATLLANQEEDQIRQLATLLIEKQLHKLEAKLAFFNEMENVTTRAREQLDRSRQKLYHQRAMIIASRLGLPASSSRGVPPSFPTSRIPLNLANSGPRPPINMNPQRPPMSNPMSTSATTLPNPLASATLAGNLVRPSN